MKMLHKNECSVDVWNVFVSVLGITIYLTQLNLILFVCYETAQLISRDTFNLTWAYHPHAFWVIVNKTAAVFFFCFGFRAYRHSVPRKENLGK